MSNSATITDASLANAVRQFAQRVAGRFQVQRMILFGSRARGDHGKYSDVDVAVLLAGARGNYWDIKLEMIDIAYGIFLEAGFYIQPHPIWDSEWEHPETHSNPRLVQNIQREGIAFRLRSD